MSTAQRCQVLCNVNAFILWGWEPCKQPRQQPVAVPSPPAASMLSLVRRDSKRWALVQDQNPLSGRKWGASYAMSGDASAILIGAAGQVISGALTNGIDRAIDGQVTVTLPACWSCKHQPLDIVEKPSLIADRNMMNIVHHACTLTMHDAGSCCSIVIEYGCLTCTSAGKYILQLL